MSKIFPCAQCGCCCMSVNMSVFTIKFDRGDGICRYFEDKTRLCSIYEIRPFICRVDYQYENKYKSIYKWEDFCMLNAKCCEFLRNNIK